MEKAHDYALQALERARTHQERGHEAYALKLLGDIAGHPTHPHVERAETLYQQALNLADTLGMRPLLAHCYHGLGTLSSQTGQWEQARTELSAALGMYRDMEMSFWLPQTEAALAAVKGRCR